MDRKVFCGQKCRAYGQNIHLLAEKSFEISLSYHKLTGIEFEITAYINNNYVDLTLRTVQALTVLFADFGLPLGGTEMSRNLCQQFRALYALFADIGLPVEGTDTSRNSSGPLLPFLLILLEI